MDQKPSASSSQDKQASGGGANKPLPASAPASASRTEHHSHSAESKRTSPAEPKRGAKPADSGIHVSLSAKTPPPAPPLQKEDSIKPVSSPSFEKKASSAPPSPVSAPIAPSVPPLAERDFSQLQKQARENMNSIERPLTQNFPPKNSENSSTVKSNPPAPVKQSPSVERDLNVKVKIPPQGALEMKPQLSKPIDIFLKSKGLTAVSDNRSQGDKELDKKIGSPNSFPEAMPLAYNGEGDGNKKSFKLIMIGTIVLLTIILAAGVFIFGKGNPIPVPSASPVLSSSPTPDPNLDFDKDTIPDKIETAIGTNPRNMDSDGDTFSDLNEIKNGYSPMIAGSEGKYALEQLQALKDKIKAADAKFYEKAFGADDTADLQSNIKIESDAELPTSFTVKNNDKEIGKINTDYPAQVSIFKQTKSNIYLGVDPNGIGGYILYGGPFAIYKIDIKTNTLSKVIDTEGSELLNFITDISPDESQLIVIEDKIVVVNISDNSKKEFAVPAKYKVFGDALFSPDGKKFAYAAALSNPDNEAGEAFVVDIATGKQTSLKTKTGGSFEIKKWIDNDTVDYE